MELRDVALTNGIGRIVLGTGLMLAPRLAGGSWVGGDAERPGAQVFASALGARDVALGAGLVWALQRDEPAHAWLVGAALADAVDFTRTLLAGDDIPRGARAGVLAIAGASAVGCALLSATIDD
jgi:hypothetical protein